MARQGFYAIVQFFADRERAEGINVGVIVLNAETGDLRVRLSETNEYVKQRIGSVLFNETQLAHAKTSLRQRLERLGANVHREQLEGFFKQEAGVLAFVPLRSMSVTDLESDVRDLYSRLVGPRQMELVQSAPPHHQETHFSVAWSAATTRMRAQGWLEAEAPTERNAQRGVEHLKLNQRRLTLIKNNNMTLASFTLYKSEEQTLAEPALARA